MVFDIRYAHTKEQTIMATQSFKNHVRIHPLYHYVLVPGTIIIFMVSATSLIWSFSWLYLLLALGLFFLHLTVFIARFYAKMNQDRIIRAELRLRYYILTKEDLEPLEAKLSMGQLVALRFAGDADFLRLLQQPGLAQLNTVESKSRYRSGRRIAAGCRRNVVGKIKKGYILDIAPLFLRS